MRVERIRVAQPALTDGGIETSLMFHGGFELPGFASFPLLESESGRAGLREYFAPFLALAEANGLPFVLDTVTWRANPDHGQAIGYGRDALARVNREAVRFARELAGDRPGIVINGVVGPRADGYAPGGRMTAAAAEAYHAWQIGILAEAGAERITALTLTYPEEAIGVVRAAAGAGLPVMAGFTVETDGRLPCGDGLRDAVLRVDRDTDGAAAFFIVNCAHPTHFAHVLDEGGPWLERIGGIRANASTRSHAELDEATELDEGDPAALGAEYLALRDRLPAVELLGGCCGTDYRHIEAIVAAWTAGP
jgi:homocysteine S-methyltransferase